MKQTGVYALTPCKVFDDGRLPDRPFYHLITNQFRPPAVGI